MTLGIFSDDFYPHIGGMGRYVYEVAGRLPKTNLIVFSPCDNNIGNHVRVYPPLHRWFRNLSFSFWLHKHVNQVVKKFRLSRINIQCGPGGLFILRKLNLPVVATCYHTWWQQSHYIKSQFWKRAFMPFERRTYRLADRIICISDDSRSMLVEKYKINPAKLVVISPGVDTDKFFPIEDIEAIPNSLLYVGRIDKRKGVDFLLRSIPAVVHQIPDLRLFVGGAGKDLARLKEYVKAENLGSHVEFLGFIPDDLLNTWYNKVKCVVIPSIFEGFGLTAVEAMAAGTGVICTRGDSLRNLVEDGVCGYLVDYDNTEQLSARIVALLNDMKKQNEFSAKGRQIAEKQYSWDVISKRLCNVLITDGIG